MAYFPNGTSGDAFIESTCLDCVHWKDEADGRDWGCPVFDVHLRFAYDLCNKKSDPGKVILDTLITPELKCTMFHPHGRDTRTLPLFREG